MFLNDKKLIPITILRVDKIVSGDSILPDEWMVTRIFELEGKEIYIKGFGRSRAEAILDFQAELEEAELEV